MDNFESAIYRELFNFPGQLYITPDGHQIYFLNDKKEMYRVVTEENLKEKTDAEINKFIADALANN